MICFGAETLELVVEMETYCLEDIRNTVLEMKDETLKEFCPKLSKDICVLRNNDVGQVVPSSASFKEGMHHAKCHKEMESSMTVPQNTVVEKPIEMAETEKPLDDKVPQEMHLPSNFINNNMTLNEKGEDL